MAVDSTNGYLYVTYSELPVRKHATRIELIRSRDNGTHLGHCRR